MSTGAVEMSAIRAAQQARKPHSANPNRAQERARPNSHDEGSATNPDRSAAAASASAVLAAMTRRACEMTQLTLFAKRAVAEISDTKNSVWQASATSGDTTPGNGSAEPKSPSS